VPIIFAEIAIIVILENTRITMTLTDHK